MVHQQNVNHGTYLQPNNHYIHYQVNDGESVGSSCDYSKNIVYNGNLIKNPFDIPQNHNNNQNNNPYYMKDSIN